MLPDKPRVYSSSVEGAENMAYWEQPIRVLFMEARRAYMVADGLPAAQDPRQGLWYTRLTIK